MQITVRMPEEYRPQLEKLVKEMGLKKSDVVRMAIKEFIANHSAETEYPFSKARNLIGVAQSGVNDLGRHHRKHLLARIKTGHKSSGA